ncbi:hypothetical protein IWW55_006471 [Coemansia sp. RSA 2706]|nr:hypothetical protein LPJ70_007509 [Coemansia sp. RSA 2708]KAJ1833663.1 hypothetical protein LPJ63_002591 [Coemansia sp. RSA 2711]KAJ2288601.1 hypothetical protein IWW55_006471 [Coemansia sp. RSA 2706]KAJ2299029.1 hypothetical protein IWW54_006543 [Coemansia sp. RSA 2705]KAJ2305353.1 hypothetical protein IWW52_006433 [Coemansia sp. RSA 2704]KAJ2315472.1 hypothetical protein IWW51_005848 [Coemansia sp. RSA 2702]KAJ2711660.1 hypothetical protein H4R23_006325 [Coemansia sp. Cherry 401B]
MDEEGAQRQRADDKLLQLLDIVAEYQSVRETSSSKLKQAYFDLARAKRAAGYQWISPDLYSNRAQAIAAVDIDSAGAIGYTRRQPEARSANNEGAGEPSAGGLRRRGDKQPNAEKAKDSDRDLKGTEKSKAKLASDPLLWFGMLVPPALKEAQSQFTLSLEELVQLAELKRRLAHAQTTLHSNSDV